MLMTIYLLSANSSFLCSAAQPAHLFKCSSFIIVITQQCISINHLSLTSTRVHHVWIRICFVFKLISSSRSSKRFTMESCHMWGESRTIWIEESCQQRGSNCFEFKEARSRTVLNSICNVFICHICQDKVTSDSIMSNVFLIDSFWAAAPLTTPLPHPIKC